MTTVPDNPTLINPCFSKFKEWRSNQPLALKKLLENNKRIMILEDPTGCGKSLIAETYTKLLDNPRSIYATITKKLQDQLEEYFGVKNGGFAEILKGRANYSCILVKGRHADECAHTKDNPCPFRNECPYQVQKEKAFMSEQVVLNLHGLINHLVHTENLEDRDLLILDEADNLEEVLTQFCTKKITANQLMNLQLKMPKWGEDRDYWIDWLETTLETVQHYYSDVKDYLDEDSIAKYLTMLHKLTFLSDNLDESWDISTEAGGYGMFVQFIPMDISGVAQKFIFSKFRKILLMSATFCAVNIFANTHKLQDFNYTNLKSTFPVKRRPIYFVPIDYVNRNITDSGKQDLADAIDFILTKIRNGTPHNAIIHTTSNWLAEDLMELCDTEMELYNSGQDDILYNFKKKEIHTIISPSLMRGHDFPDDECRINIIAKLPYPNLGEPVVNFRKEEIKGWYDWKTVIGFIQESGRSTRSKEDYSLTFILDQCFEKYIKNPLLPDYWKEAICEIKSEEQINQNLLEEAKHGN